MASQISPPRCSFKHEEPHVPHLDRAGPCISAGSEGKRRKNRIVCQPLGAFHSADVIGALLLHAIAKSIQLKHIFRELKIEEPLIRLVYQELQQSSILLYEIYSPDPTFTRKDLPLVQ